MSVKIELQSKKRFSNFFIVIDDTTKIRCSFCLAWRARGNTVIYISKLSVKTLSVTIELDYSC